jgi:glycosyltransferase involved in cell wall biosynthesis
MKILYICSADLSGETGSLGSVRHIFEVSENLCRLGNRIKLIAPKYAYYSNPTPVEIIYVPLLKIRILRTFIYEILAAFLMIVYMLLWKPAIIYWRQSYLTFFPVLLSRLFHKKIVTEINGFTLDELDSEPLSKARKKIILSLEKFNYTNSSHLICVAPKIREKIIKYYNLPKRRVSVILNGVNSDRMPAISSKMAKKALGIDPNTKIIGFVGHFFPWDGLEYLIEAAPKIVQKEKNVKFLIIGHGKWGEHLPKLVFQKGLDDYFLFTGKVSWEKLYLYVNAFDIATAPYSKSINSQSGRSSLKILEYFACKKPVVASRTSAIPEIADLEEKGFGITVPSENPEALAKAILGLLKNQDLLIRMGQQSRVYVKNERSWKQVAVSTLQIINTLV